VTAIDLRSTSRSLTPRPPDGVRPSRQLRDLVELEPTSRFAHSRLHYAEIEALGYLMMGNQRRIALSQPGPLWRKSPASLLVRAPGRRGMSFRLPK